MIRQCNDEDMDKIVNIWLDASLSAHNFIPEEYWKSKTDDMKYIYLPSSEIFVNTVGQSGEADGFISLVDDYVAAIFVSPSQQGKGLGSELIEYTKSIRPTLTLSVYAENTNSVEFYKKHGFKIKYSKIDPNTGHEEHIMEYSQA